MTYFKTRIVAVLLIALIIAMFPSCSSKKNDEVIFKVEGEYILWKYVDEDQWNNLISIRELNESGALTGQSAYDIAVSQGFEGTQSDWIASLKGAQGDIPYIGENGNWWIGKEDTGVSATGNSNGTSLYIIPDFIGMTANEIAELAVSKRFLISYIGDTDNGNLVASQSVTAGLAAAEGTRIRLYMTGWSNPSDNTELPTEPPSQSPTEKPTDSPTEKPTEKPTDPTIEPPSETPTDTPSEKPTDTPTENPTETPSDNTNNEIILINMTSTVSRGKEATVTVKGVPNTEYAIKVWYASGNLSSAAGLKEPQISDSNGEVSWTWRVGASTKTGNAKIEISGGGQTLTVYMEIVDPEA